MMVSASDIKAAAEEIAGEVIRTPLVPAPRLGESLGCELYLKLESLFAFQVAHQRFVNRPGVDHRDLLPLVDRGG